MAFMINGIGTKHYGKRNLERYTGVCEYCKKERQLKSYITKKYFCFFWIPLFPLTGDLQIFDYCSRCNTGKVIDLKNSGSQSTCEADNMNSLNENSGAQIDKSDDKNETQKVTNSDNEESRLEFEKLLGKARKNPKDCDFTKLRMAYIKMREFPLILPTDKVEQLEALIKEKKLNDAKIILESLIDN